MKRLHLGCGRDIRPGWINLDARPGEGIDVVADLDACARTPLPFPDDSIDELLGSHLLEHIRDPLPLMQELYRIAKPGAMAVLHLPYGSSDDAFSDPTHVRPYFLESFGYFSQPWYWRADYGYRGDWQAEEVVLKLPKSRNDGKTVDQILDEVHHLRNVVREMTAVLRAVKPARAPLRELQAAPQIRLVLIEGT